MPAAYSGISNVSAGDVASAGSLNQYKESLEGARDFVPILWATADNNIVMRVGDAAGANSFDVQDYSGVSQFKVSSDGAVTSTSLKAVTTMRVITDVDLPVSTITPTDVTGLSFAIGANEIWALDMVLLTCSSTTADITFSWTYPVDCTMRWGNRGSSQNNAGADPSAGVMPTTHNLDGPITWTPSFGGYGVAPASPVPVSMYGLVTNGATAGTVQLQFAQLVSDATVTSVEAQSFIIATKVS